MKNISLFLFLTFSIFLSNNSAAQQKTIDFREVTKSITLPSEILSNSKSEELSNSNTTQIPLTISSENPVICGDNQNIKLTTENIPNARYQWFYYGTSGPAVELNDKTTHEIIVQNPGIYFLFLYTNGKTRQSNYFQVSNNSLLIMKDMEDQIIDKIYAKPGNPAQFKVYHYGSDVLNITNDKKTITKIAAFDNPQVITLTQNVNDYFSLYMEPSVCGTETFAYGLSLIVDTTTSFKFNTPKTLEACAGGSVDIPYTTKGIWGNDVGLVFELVDLDGVSIPNSTSNGYGIDTFNITINKDLAIGTKFKVKFIESFTPRMPYFSITTDEIFTITATGCKPKAYIQSITDTLCLPIFLNAYPEVSGYNYKFYKDGKLIKDLSNNVIRIQSSGEYRVVISGPDGYYSESKPRNFIVNTTLNTVFGDGIDKICSGEVKKTAGFINNLNITNIQWFVQDATNQSYPIKDANSPTLTIDKPGNYFFAYTNGDCKVTSNVFSTCGILISTNKQTVCSGGWVVVRYNKLNGDTKNNLQLYIDSFDETPKSYLLINFNFNVYQGSIEAHIGSNIPSGNYRYRMTETDSLGNIITASAYSPEILEVINGIPNPPQITGDKLVVCEKEIALLTAEGCTGSILWNDSFVGKTYTQLVTETSNYTATCRYSGCESSLNSNVITIRTEPKPTVSFIDNSPFYFGNEITIEALGAKYFLWSGPNNFKSSDSKISIKESSPLNAGIYNVIATSVNGCTSTYNILVDITTLLAKFRENLDDIKLYPNPATDYLILNSDDEIMRIEVRKTDGSLLFEVGANNVEVSNLPSGKYFLVIETNKKTIVKQFIKL
jgi:large repetitive protein